METKFTVFLVYKKKFISVRSTELDECCFITNTIYVDFGTCSDIGV